MQALKAERQLSNTSSDMEPSRKVKIGKTRDCVEQVLEAEGLIRSGSENKIKDRNDWKLFLRGLTLQV